MHLRSIYSKQMSPSRKRLCHWQLRLDIKIINYLNINLHRGPHEEAGNPDPRHSCHPKQAAYREVNHASCSRSYWQCPDPPMPPISEHCSRRSIIQSQLTILGASRSPLDIPSIYINYNLFSFYNNNDMCHRHATVLQGNRSRGLKWRCHVKRSANLATQSLRKSQSESSNLATASRLGQRLIIFTNIRS